MTHSNDALTLLASQISIPPTPDAATRDAHLKSSADKVRARLAGQPADLVVLPELSSIDYSREAFDHLDQIAEPLDGPSFQTWREVAMEYDTHVSYSFARQDGDKRYISIAVVKPDGTLAGHYDKLHMCQYGASMEKEYFDRGSAIFTFEINGFTLSPIICYDIRIPELCRTLTLRHGVDVILHCGAYFRDESFPTWHDFVTTRALENQVFFLSLNRAGGNWGNSTFCWPWVDKDTPRIGFDQHAEEFRHITLTKDRLHQAREAYTFLKDRLEDYGAL